MWAYTDEEIDYLSSTSSTKKTGNGNAAPAAATAAPDLRGGGGTGRAASAAAAIASVRDDRDAGPPPPRAAAPAPVRPPKLSWTRLHDSATQLIARLDPAVAKLNTALLVVAGILAYVDVVFYLALKAWSYDVQWTILLQAYSGT